MDKETVVEIEKKFPKMPRHYVKLFAKQISKNKNPRNTITSREQFIHTQIKACIRHKMTVYENLIYLGVDKEKARGIVKEKVQEIYNEWKGGE